MSIDWRNHPRSEEFVVVDEKDLVCSDIQLQFVISFVGTFHLSKLNSAILPYPLWVSAGARAIREFSRAKRVASRTRFVRDVMSMQSIVAIKLKEGRWKLTTQLSNTRLNQFPTFVSKPVMPSPCYTITLSIYSRFALGSHTIELSSILK